MESFNSKEMHGKKVRDVYVKVYDARETTFSDQTGQFPPSCHRIQLVGGLLIEPLVRGSNPSGARVQWIGSC